MYVRTLFRKNSRLALQHEGQHSSFRTCFQAWNVLDSALHVTPRPYTLSVLTVQSGFCKQIFGRRHRVSPDVIS